MTLAQQKISESPSREARGRQKPNGYDTNFFDSFKANGGEGGVADSLAPHEQRSLELVAESLSRLGRAKTLGLGVEEKAKFVDAWTGKAKERR